MINTVSITNLKQNTANVVESVKEKSPIWVIQRSEPVVVILSYKHYQKLEEAQKAKRLSKKGK